MEQEVKTFRSDQHTSMQQKTISIINNKYLQYLFPPSILTVLTALIYYPSLYYPFQFDDIANISKRFGIRFDNPLSRCWDSSRWFGDFLNSINFQIGRFDPFYYRLFNLMIHIFAGLCVFYLIKELCLCLRKRDFFYENASFIAFASAGLFLLHPVQTQTVSYVIQARLEGLASLAVIGTVLIYVKLSQAKNIVSKLCLSALLFMAGLVACGTKELVVVLPFLLLIVDWFFICQEDWQQFKKRLWIFALFSLFFTLLIIHHMGTKFIIDAISMKSSTGNNRGNILTAGAFDIITPWSFLITEFKVIIHYFLIFIWPFNISVEYDWTIAQSFFSAEVILPLMLLLGIAYFILNSVWKRKNQVYAFGLLWFLLSIAPRATIIPSPELVCDYKTYLASVGMMFILAVPLVLIFKYLYGLVKHAHVNFYAHETQLAIIACILLIVGHSAYERNKVWETSVGFWEDNARKAPNKARVHNNLGVALSEVGKIDESIVAYKKAIDMDSYYADPLSNLAVAYSLKNETDKAIEALRGAIHICPNYPEAYNNLGTLLLQKKQYDDAQQMLEIAIQLRPYYGKAYYNMARLYEEKGDHNKSWELLKLATTGDLDTPEVIFKFGQMSLRVQKYDEAADAFERVIKMGVQQDQIHFNLANAYYMQGNHEKAMNIYEQLVRNNPLDARYAFNLAEAYFAKKEFTHAYEMFRKASAVPQPVAQAFFRAAHCLEQMNKTSEAIAFLNEVLTLNAADDFKTMARNELVRIETQQNVIAHGGDSIGLNELQKTINKYQANKNPAPQVDHKKESKKSA